MAAKPATDPRVDAFLEHAERWSAGMRALRKLALSSGLVETLKWGKPCYTFEGHNVVLIQPFKAQFALLFCKGSLLEDPRGLLARPGANSRVARRLEFSADAEVAAQAKAIRGFVAQALEVERAGQKVPPREGPEPLPAAFEEAFASTPGLEAAFRALTPGRQRAYALHVGGAKREATQRSRVAKVTPRILAGKGLRD